MVILYSVSNAEINQYLDDVSGTTIEGDEVVSNPNDPPAFSPPTYSSLVMTDPPPKYTALVSVGVHGNVNTRHDQEPLSGV